MDGVALTARLCDRAPMDHRSGTPHLLSKHCWRYVVVFLCAAPDVIFLCA